MKQSLKRFVDKWEPEDVVAWTIMIACFIAILNRHDGSIKDAMIGVGAVYFVKKTSKLRFTRKNNGNGN